MTAVTGISGRNSPQSVLYEVLSSRDQVRGDRPHLTCGAVEGPSTQGP